MRARNEQHPGGLPPDLAALLAQTTAGLDGPPEEEIGGFYAPPERGQLPEGWHPPMALTDDYKPAQEGDLLDPYREGDEYAILNRMPSEQLLRFQDQMVAMGIVGGVLPGQIDDNTAKALRTFMAMGNRRGQTWQSTYQQVVTSYEAGEFGGIEEDAEPTLVRQDPATLAQKARRYMEGELGREISESELQAAASVWAGFDHKAAQQQVDLESRDGTAMKNEVTLIDPEARFLEWFEGRYKPEVGRRDSLAQAEESRTFAMNQIGRIDQMIGGGR